MLSRDAVLREGVRLVAERDKALARLDQAIEEGLASVEAGGGKPIEEVRDRLVARYRKMAEDRGV